MPTSLGVSLPRHLGQGACLPCALLPLHAAAVARRSLANASLLEPAGASGYGLECDSGLKTVPFRPKTSVL